MKTVTINKGIYFGKEISGTFELLGEWFPDNAPVDAQGDGKVFVEMTVSVAVFGFTNQTFHMMV